MKRRVFMLKVVPPDPKRNRDADIAHVMAVYRAEREGIEQTAANLERYRAAGWKHLPPPNPGVSHVRNKRPSSL